jgi:hypothetical protein
LHPSSQHKEKKKNKEKKKKKKKKKKFSLVVKNILSLHLQQRVSAAEIIDGLRRAIESNIYNYGTTKKRLAFQRSESNGRNKNLKKKNVYPCG